MTGQPHPEQLRRAALRSTPGSPWVTWYDIATSARIELSSTTMANWVAKAGGLLAEEFDVAAGDEVAVELPLHWQLHVWVWAAWSLGAVVVPAGTSGGSPAVVVAGPGWTAGAAGPAAPVLACPTDAFALPLRDRTPPGALDAMAEVPGYPDHFPTPLPAPTAPALLLPGALLLDGAAVTARAAALAPDGVGPLMVTGSPDGADALLAAVLAPAATDGTAVLVSGEPSPSDLARIEAAERVAPGRILVAGAG